MRVVYLCNFDLGKSSGKERATRQKLEALSKVTASLKVISGPSRSRFAQLISIFYLDFVAALHIAIKRPDVLISRGFCGILSQKIARVLGITTVREVHSDIREELSLLKFGRFDRSVLRFFSAYSHYVDLSANIRIFNHPSLLSLYKYKYGCPDSDFFVYNGFDRKARSFISKADARKKFNLSVDKKILVFIGSASKWHGVEYLIELQKFFDKDEEPIEIIFGGGDISEFDHEKRCINFTPLNDLESADLIRAADFCLLPVKQNRGSPGSPLKLYDYIANERFVFAQEAVVGYSDEVDRLSVGYPVDFTNANKAKAQILKAYDLHDFQLEFPLCFASWSDRMQSWISGISKFRKKGG